MRGQPDMPVVMSRTYIATPNRQSLFYRKLAAELRHNGVQVVDSPLDAGATLNILDDETGQRVISVSARNIPREYEVFYRIIYSVQNESGTMLEPQEQTVARDYTYDETLVLGKAQEEELIVQRLPTTWFGWSCSSSPRFRPCAAGTCRVRTCCVVADVGATQYAGCWPVLTRFATS